MAPDDVRSQNSMNCRSIGGPASKVLCQIDRAYSVPDDTASHYRGEGTDEAIQGGAIMRVQREQVIVGRVPADIVAELVEPARKLGVTPEDFVLDTLGAA